MNPGKKRKASAILDLEGNPGKRKRRKPDAGGELLKKVPASCPEHLRDIYAGILPRIPAVVRTDNVHPIIILLCRVENKIQTMEHPSASDIAQARLLYEELGVSTSGRERVPEGVPDNPFDALGPPPENGN